MTQWCADKHVFKPIFEKYGRWYGCSKCLMLGRCDDTQIVPVKCIMCENAAITLNQWKLGEYSPVCIDHFIGILMPFKEAARHLAARPYLF